jgi:hypothetical protein
VRERLGDRKKTKAGEKPSGRARLVLPSFSETLFSPATTMGDAAPFSDIVPNTSNSVEKCASATTNDSRVAP